MTATRAAFTPAALAEVVRALPARTHQKLDVERIDAVLDALQTRPNRPSRRPSFVK